MSTHATFAWWQHAVSDSWARWVVGYIPAPETWPPPPDGHRLPPAAGVPLPGPVASGWALDYYRRRGWWRQRTPIGREMWRFKYRGDLDAGWRLVHVAAGFLSAQLDSNAVDCVVPVPSSPEFREYSASQWLGEKLALTMGKPAMTDLFIRSRLGTQQKELSTFEARQANIRGLFTVAPHHKRKIRGKRILLTDDLSKSGYTLAELRKVLSDAGSGKIIPFAFVEAGNTRKGL